MWWTFEFYVGGDLEAKRPHKIFLTSGNKHVHGQEGRVLYLETDGINELAVYDGCVAAMSPTMACYSEQKTEGEGGTCEGMRETEGRLQ